MTQASGATGADTSARTPTIAISLGDPNGIGPEVVLKALEALVPVYDARFLLVGSAEVLRMHARKMRLSAENVQVLDAAGIDTADKTAVLGTAGTETPDQICLLDTAGEEPINVEFGSETPAAGRLAMEAVERTVDLCLDGTAEAMVTAPLSKAAVHAAGFTFTGHTGYIARRTGAGDYTMMMVAGALRVGLVTTHVPVSEVPSLITSEAIGRHLHVMNRSLIEDLQISDPRIAILGLNPHAGDRGLMGDEEANIIRPAIEKAAADGIQTAGPFPADAYFARSGYERHDAVLAMYHDQGLVPFKALAFETGVNYTAGLPIVRTSPDHGTAFDIAGKGRASPKSMESAIRLALEIAERRKRQAQK